VVERTRDGARTDRRVEHEERRAERAAALDALVAADRLACPDGLPIGERRDDLLTAIREHQVVVVAGETGSGKSTQLPKLCLELGRGVDGLIGHTQPRRVAARTIAARVAEELGVAVGDEVGFSVRFDDRVRERTLVRVMTDGILLAEVQRDPMLRRYDTLIIDEAHERSLNIDFLLGYLAQLLPRRPDLKLIITSATIDTERFAEHFGRDGVPAPIVEVSGRTYPVEVRYRPYGGHPEAADDDERDQVQAICDAVEELAVEGQGDVLVFLSGEREIHDTADAIRALELRDTEVLPLYARLSAHEQHRIFEPHRGRRIVLATNVAETSITVPGVRYVVDTGTARISRYSRRLKVQRLPIEPISRASADQRAGRCGRVAPGICIRLYGEEEFAHRPAFTEPEILRTNLASVILQMTSIGLGDVEAFPFVEPPDRAAVRDGERLLDELGAITLGDDGDRRLTPVGRRLARLPIDPRLGRMVLEAERFGVVREVLVIAAALSIQDPRERPQEGREVANALHKRFDVEGSDLLSIVALWDHLRAEQRQRSSNQFRKLCRAEHLNYLRIREWQDLFSQLRRVAGELGIRAGGDRVAGEERELDRDGIHRAVLAGLLSQLGLRQRTGREYRGARGSTFVIAPGSVLTRGTARWVMAAELVETHRLFARRVAAIRPEWAEEAGAHLLERSYGEPRWDARRGAAVVDETVTLYGLPIVERRTVPFARVDRAGARAMFLRHALVDGDWHTHHAFVEHNRHFVARVRELEARVRRRDLLDEDDVYDVYDERVPDSVVSARHFDRWWKQARRERPDLLDLTDELLAELGVHPADFPDTWDADGVRLPIEYRYEPGDPLDGVTVRIPLTALNQVGEGFDWHVPGHRPEVVAWLLRTLPKDVRRALIPAAESAAEVVRRLGPPTGRLVDRLAVVTSQVAGVPVTPDMFHPEHLDPHLRVHLVVVDGHGEVVDAGTDPATLWSRCAPRARAAIAAAVPLRERRGITAWDTSLGTVPEVVAADLGDHTVRGYPTLLDEETSVSLRIVTTRRLQERRHREGVRRLLVLTAAPTRASLVRDLPNRTNLALVRAGVPVEDLADDCVLAAADAVLARSPLPWDEGAFAELQRAAKASLRGLAIDALGAVADVLAVVDRVDRLLDGLVAEALAPTVADARAHLDRLVAPGFVIDVGIARLPDVRRAVEGIEHRLTFLDGEVARDQRRMAEVRPLERRYASLVAGGRLHDEEVQLIRWELEDLRLALFAGAKAGRVTMSTVKLAKRLSALGG
jgi:ATP-dependent helicase HrpA